MVRSVWSSSPPGCGRRGFRAAAYPAGSGRAPNPHARFFGALTQVGHAPDRYRHTMLTTASDPRGASDRRGMKASIAVAADLRARIARGYLVDGQALPVESELMVELGVSKGVMRE